MGIGENIRQERKRQDLTAQQVGELAGLSAKAVYRIETGEIKDPSISSIASIAKALKTTIDALYHGEHNDTIGIIGQVISDIDLTDDEERRAFLDLLDRFQKQIWIIKKVRKLKSEKEAIELQMDP